MIKRAARRLAVAAECVVLASCCAHPPCPSPPIAIIINLTVGPAGGPVNGAIVHVSGATITDVPCNATCYVSGYAGTYILEIEAPGFERSNRTVTVTGEDPTCGCPSNMAERLQIALIALP
jgi:PEGA domain-containing protein